MPMNWDSTGLQAEDYLSGNQYYADYKLTSVGDLHPYVTGVASDGVYGITTTGMTNFDGGDDYVSLNSPLNYDIVTLTAWVYRDEVSSTGEDYIVGNPESGGYGLTYSTSNSKKWCFVARTG